MADRCISVQRVCTDKETELPSDAQLQRWCQLALESEVADVNIRLVDGTESQYLNKTYRDKDQPTNVLSFPFEAPAGLDDALLGDIVICPAVVAQEAKAQAKRLENHWAHMIIHGTLHLRGFDHINEHEANVMEAKEIALLETLDIPNPYGDTNE